MTVHPSGQNFVTSPKPVGRAESSLFDVIGDPLGLHERCSKGDRHLRIDAIAFNAGIECEVDSSALIPRGDVTIAASGFGTR